MSLASVAGPYRIYTQLTTNLESPYFLDSAIQANTRNLTTYTHNSFPSSSIGTLHINLQGTDEDPYSIYQLLHDRSEMAIASKRFELQSDGRIVSILPREFIVYSSTGDLLETLKVPEPISLINDWKMLPTEIKFLGTSATGEQLICSVAAKTTCIKTTEAGQTAKAVGIHKFIKAADNFLYSVGGFVDGDKAFIRMRKGE
jgi:hypothetical protein